VLYEGYLLYPYRKSSPKNRVRWQFGVVAPRRWIEARGPVTDGVAGSAEWWSQQTQCLAEAPDTAAVHLGVRCLQLQRKDVEELLPDGNHHRVEELELDGVRHLSFDEAVPREITVDATLGELLAGGREVAVELPAGREVERLRRAVGEDGGPRGRVVRTTQLVTARVRLSAERVPAPFHLLRLTVCTENTVDDVDVDMPRDDALRRSLLAAHTVMALDDGAFLSLTDPPAWAEAAARECRNLRTFPVLGGPPGERGVVLSAPIILYDHPQVAPESPGDLHDATEIDEILSLRTLTLTDEEKREARSTDPRAAAIVDRVDRLPPEAMQRLHGVIRSMGPATSDLPPAAQPRPAVRWWSPEADESVDPSTDAVEVAGVLVRRGSRVRLHPRRRGTDAHDMFMAGRTAQVEAVLLDVDGSQHVAVTLDDDPGAELHQWYGRFRYYQPEELEPLEPAAEEVHP